MAIWAEVSKGSLQHTRIDSEFYHPKYLVVDTLWAKVSSRLSVSPMRRLLKRPVRTGHTPRNREILPGDHPVHFIKTDTLREGRIEYDRCEFLPTRSIGPNDLIPNDGIIVTIIGATRNIVGRAAIRRADDPKAVTNQNVAVIDFRTVVDPYFVVAFLNCEYGRSQLWRHSRQTEQVNLNCREVERVKIPVLPEPDQRAIGDIMRASFHSLDRATGLYSSAQELLESMLGIQEINCPPSMGHQTMLSEIREARRFDGEYFKPAFVRIVEHVRKYRSGNEPLLRNIQEVRPTIDPSKQPDETFRYSELADINPSIGVITSATDVLGREAPSRARRLVVKDDVLVSAVAGSIDKAALVGEKFDGTLASTGFFQFRSDKYDPRFLLILLRCKATRMQLEREATGGILSAVSRSRLRNVVIPIVPEHLQDEIARKVGESHAAYREAEALLEKAKKRVEELILKEAAA